MPQSVKENENPSPIKYTTEETDKKNVEKNVSKNENPSPIQKLNKKNATNQSIIETIPNETDASIQRENLISAICSATPWGTELNGTIAMPKESWILVLKELGRQAHLINSIDLSNIHWDATMCDDLMDTLKKELAGAPPGSKSGKYLAHVTIDIDNTPFTHDQILALANELVNKREIKTISSKLGKALGENSTDVTLNNLKYEQNPEFMKIIDYGNNTAKNGFAQISNSLIENWGLKTLTIKNTPLEESVLMKLINDCVSTSITKLDIDKYVEINKSIVPEQSTDEFLEKMNKLRNNKLENLNNIVIDGTEYVFQKALALFNIKLKSSSFVQSNPIK